jgi:nucleoside-diphosphate-sugar epimerase
MKKIFVTGATGYLGRALCERLSDTDAIVHAVCRSPEKSQLIQKPNIRIFHGQLQDNEVLKQAMKGCDQIYHLAACTKIWSRDVSIYEKINVEATNNILNLALENNVQRAVVTSTAGVFPPSNGQYSTYMENSSNDILETEYARSKMRAEKVAFSYVEKGLEVVVVNPSRIYGPGPEARTNSITKMIRSFRDGKWRFIPGDGNSVGNYVYIDDVVNGHILAMEKGNPGERYILGGTNISYNDFFDLLRRLTRSDHHLFHVPTGILISFAQIQKFLAKYFGMEPVIMPEWVRQLSQNRYLSSQKAMNDLGYEITPVEEGITQTLDWLAES